MLIPKEILDNLGKSGGKMAWLGSPVIAIMFYMLINWNVELSRQNVKYHDKVIQLDTLCKIMQVNVKNCERYTREAVNNYIDCTKEKEALLELNREFSIRLKSKKNY
jgi:hypothetical protein